MKPGTRMMMISSLGEDRRRMGFQSEQPEVERGRSAPRGGWENEYDEPESDYGPQAWYDYKERDSPRNYGRPESMSPWRREKMARELGEDRYRERMDKERREGSDRREPEFRRRMYDGRQRPMDHYGEEDEDDMSGSFRHSKAKGHVPEENEEELTEERVRKWVNGMKNGDGKTGAHYQMDQAELLRANHCPQCDKLEFWGCINMMHSDYYEVAKRLNVDRPEFYANMAKAFLMDKDAPDNKLAMYITYVAGK